MSTHSQANAAFLPPTAQFPLKHPKCPFGESGIDGGKERGRPGVVKGLDRGWKSIHACRTRNSLIQARAWEQAILTHSQSYTDPHFPLWRPLRPCSVSISSWPAKFTNSLRNITCSYCLNCTLAGLNGNAVFMNAATKVLAYMLTTLSRPPPAEHTRNLAYFVLVSANITRSDTTATSFLPQH